MKKKLCVILTFIFMLSVRIFAAGAHLEGDTDSGSLFEKLGIDADYLMENWHVIVVILVCIGCAAGLIYGNAVYFARKRANKKDN